MARTREVSRVKSDRWIMTTLVAGTPVEREKNHAVRPATDA